MEILSIPGFSEPFSSIGHLIAAFFSLIGGVIIIVKGKGNTLRQFSLYIYTFSLVFLFSMSGVYHLLEPEGLPRTIFQRLDHAGIYVLIAGTFTAIHFVFFTGHKRWFYSTLVWSLAIIGLIFTVIFFDSIPEWLLCSFYLALGWIGIISGYLLNKHYGKSARNGLIYGGIAYSVGAIVMLLNWPIIIPGIIHAHEIFHIAVIIAAYLHWKLIYNWATNPSSKRLTFIVRKRGDQKYLAQASTESFTINATSFDEIKQKIKECIDKKYHPSMKPVSVRIKTLNEDIFHVN